MTRTFNYTHSKSEYGSSLVRYAVYNANDKELLVALGAHGSRTATWNVYAYGGVTQDDYNKFVRADSKGSYYNYSIKGVFPRTNGTELWGDINFRMVDVKRAPKSTGETKTTFKFDLPSGAEVTFSGVVTLDEFKAALAKALPGIEVNITSRVEQRVENFS